MTGTAGLDGMGGMHGSTGGGSSMNLDQGREMVRRGASAGHGCCACLSLRLMSAPAPRAGDLMTCLLCPALWSLHSGLKPVPSSRGQTPAVMELLICGCASSTLRDLLRIERKSAKVWPGAQQEASFKAFLERPENRPLVEGAPAQGGAAGAQAAAAYHGVRLPAEGEPAQLDSSSTEAGHGNV